MPVTVNPLRELEPLPQVHYSYQGIDSSYILGEHGTMLSTMVDYARIMGSFPATLDDTNSLDTAVEICRNASQLHPSGRLPVLEVGGSPWLTDRNPMNMSIEAPELEKLRGWQRNISAELAASNARLGTSVVIGAGPDPPPSA